MEADRSCYIRIDQSTYLNIILRQTALVLLKRITLLYVGINQIKLLILRQSKDVNSNMASKLGQIAPK